MSGLPEYGGFLLPHGLRWVRGLQHWLQRGMLEVVPGCVGLLLWCDWRLSVGVISSGGLLRWGWLYYTAHYPESYGGRFAQRNEREREELYQDYCRHFYPLLWVFRSGIGVGVLLALALYGGAAVGVTYGLLGYYLLTTAIHVVILVYLLPAARR